ncbi:MAG TPA: hypothetical protein VND93_13720 [Myxococcales bacterium]|jgi:hypothetical protein|nr:hypothetical protein [Myxococcales bacterium]
MDRPLLVAAACGLLCGCALGGMRAREVNAMGPYREMAVRTTAVTTATAVRAPQEVTDGLQAGLLRGLGGWNEARGTGPIDPEQVLTVDTELLEYHPGREMPPPTPPRRPSEAPPPLDLDINRVAVKLTLRAPGEQDPVGQVVWDSISTDPTAALAERVGWDAGRALADQMLDRRDQYVTRHPGDERNVFSPSARLLEPGQVLLSDSEVLILHLGVGITRWLELDLSAGGLPLPAVGGIAFAGAGVVGAGGAGIAVVGAVSAGVKLRLLEEGKLWPGVSLGYDLVDAFGAALGGAGIFIAGSGIAGVAGAGAAGANVQLNVFTLAASKRVGLVEFGAGAAVIDNHHFLPQSAAFATGITNGDTSSAVFDLDQLPTVYLPYASFAFLPLPWVRLMQELFPQQPFDSSFGVTGLRVVVGTEGGWGPFSLSRLKATFELAMTESYVNITTSGRAAGWRFLPWGGLGFYFQ